MVRVRGYGWRAGYETRRHQGEGSSNSTPSGLGSRIQRTPEFESQRESESGSQRASGAGSQRGSMLGIRRESKDATTSHIRPESYMGSESTKPRIEAKYSWNPAHTELVKDAWLNYISRCFSGILQQERDKTMKDVGTENIVETKGHGPSWMSPLVWDGLILYWSNEAWQNKSATATNNRNTLKEGEITKHSGGSISFVIHQRRMEAELKRPVTQLEVFNKTHRKKSGEGFINKKSKTVNERYATALSSKYSDSASQPEFDADAWLKATGGPKKGRLYGFGTRVPADDILGISSEFKKGNNHLPQYVTQDQVEEIVRRIVSETQRNKNKEMEDQNEGDEEMGNDQNEGDENYVDDGNYDDGYNDDEGDNGRDYNNDKYDDDLE